MRGLLTKDFRLIAGQKKFFFVVILIAVLFLFSGDNALFAVAYATMLCAYFSMSTLHYDEFNKGNVFLFTLPFSRKQYVEEKYLFGVLLGGAAWLCFSVLGVAANNVTHQEISTKDWFGTVVLYLAVMFYLLALSFPLQFKFGAEKGRMAMLVVFVVIFMAIIFAKKIPGVNTGLLNLSLPALEGIVFVVGVIFLLISMQISIKIMEKRQF